jgi:hypothetical protein
MGGGDDAARVVGEGVRVLSESRMRAICMSGSFDHLVGGQQNRLRHRKSKRFCGLEVHGHLKFGRHLNRKLCRLFATENAIDIRCRAPQYISVVGSVGKQSTVFSRNNYIRDHRYVISGCQQNDLRSMDLHKDSAEMGFSTPVIAEHIEPLPIETRPVALNDAHVVPADLDVAA